MYSHALKKLSETGEKPDNEQITKWIKDNARCDLAEKWKDSTTKLAELAYTRYIPTSINTIPGFDIHGENDGDLDGIIDAKNLTDLALSHCNGILKFILCARFGIGTEERTLQQLAAQLGITRERVRQLEFAAIDRIRNVLAASKNKKKFLNTPIELLN